MNELNQRLQGGDMLALTDSEDFVRDDNRLVHAVIAEAEAPGALRTTVRLGHPLPSRREFVTAYTRMIGGQQLYGEGVVQALWLAKSELRTPRRLNSFCDGLVREAGTRLLVGHVMMRTPSEELTDAFVYPTELRDVIAGRLGGDAVRIMQEVEPNREPFAQEEAVRAIAIAIGAQLLPPPEVAAQRSTHLP